MEGLKKGEIVLISAGTGRSLFSGLEMDWIIFDELVDLEEQMKEKQEMARKNYLAMMPAWNKGRKK
jgi:hypothetical protein